MAKPNIEPTPEQKEILDGMAERLRLLFVVKGWKDAEELAQVLKRTEVDLHNWMTRWPEQPYFVFNAAVYYHHTDRSGMAINLFHRAHDMGLRGTSLLMNLASAYKQEHMDDMAEHWYSQASGWARKENNLVALAHAYHGIGSLYINRGEPHKCIEWCKRSLDLDPDDRFAKWNMGIACLEAGDWSTGGRLYHEAGFIDSKWKAPERKIKTYGGLPDWDGSKGKTVICYGEQGVGDEVMFCSILPDLLRDCKVILDVDKRLEALLKRSFPEAEAVYPTSDIDAPFPWIVNHKPDARLAMGSLMHFYRHKAEDFPKVTFLQADPVKRAKWRAELDKLGPGKHVAISYSGGLKKTRQDLRTIDPKALVDILKIPGINWHSVQYHEYGPENAAVLGRMTGVPVHHWHDMIRDWDEWAAFLSEIDLLITVNTSVHHLAGSLGVNQWCLTPKYVAWRYGISGPSPFYGNCSMYRQGPDEKWEPVLVKVKNDLERWVQNDSLLHAPARPEPERSHVALVSQSDGGGSDKGVAVESRTARKGARRRRHYR